MCHNKCNAQGCVEVISKFFKEDKVSDVRIGDHVAHAVSVLIGIDKMPKKLDLLPKMTMRKYQVRMEMKMKVVKEIHTH